MIEQDVINQLSHNLERFSWVSPEKAIFRCPRCGDSAKDPNKTRGAFFREGGVWFNGCFNGCATIPFTAYLRQYHEQLYREFKLGKLRADPDANFNLVKPKKKDTQTSNVMSLFGDSIFDGLPKLTELPRDHEAVEYWHSRRLPAKKMDQFYYTENFNEWSMKVNPRQELAESARGGIVLPLLSKTKDEIGYQCRFFEGKLRYKTIMLDEAAIKCYGMDQIDLKKSINVFEGIFDSLYLRNSIAVLDSSLHNAAEKLSAKYGIPKEQWVLWFDFERFNKDIQKKKNEAISMGYKVVFVDKKFIPDKDINAIVKNSSNPQQSLKQLFGNAKVLSGTRAKIEMGLNDQSV